MSRVVYLPGCEPQSDVDGMSLADQLRKLANDIESGEHGDDLDSISILAVVDNGFTIGVLPVSTDDTFSYLTMIGMLDCAKAVCINKVANADA